MKFILAFFILSPGLHCKESPESIEQGSNSPGEDPGNACQVGSLIMNGVCNPELTAPYDIFHHTKFREGIKPMRVLTHAADTSIVTTFEGFKLIPDCKYSYQILPPIDIQGVPGAKAHLDTALENKEPVTLMASPFSISPS